MSDALEPLPPELDEALQALAPPPEAPEIREALLSKLHVAVGQTVVGAAAGAKLAGAASGALTVPWWVAAGALVVGVSGGVVLDRVVLGPPVAVETPTVQALPPQPAPAVVAPSVLEAPPDAREAEATPSNEKEPVVRAAKPKPPSPSATLEVADAGVTQAPPNRDESLRSERLLIDAARAALTRDATSALAPLREHANRFPRGQLTEEREALMIQALMSTDVPEARRRLEAFAREFPVSPLLEPLRAALESLE